MDCPSCGTVNPRGKRFCGYCGAALPLLCPACGSENPGTRFCCECGASLISKGGSGISVDRPAELRRSSETEAERRHLTVMFCDLVGSTMLAGELDPEDLAEVIRRFQTVCTSTLENAAGHVARFMGDGVLAYFGYPKAHEDDAERAVRAGLELVARIGQLVLPSGEPLQVRVGRPAHDRMKKDRIVDPTRKCDDHRRIVAVCCPERGEFIQRRTCAPQPLQRRDRFAFHVRNACQTHIGCPSIHTMQAPHWPSPHPNLAAVSPSPRKT
jgi:Double zinc ribbon/Adenylate and Guanylate cyclase catalytic domain